MLLIQRVEESHVLAILKMSSSSIIYMHVLIALLLILLGLFKCSMSNIELRDFPSTFFGGNVLEVYCVEDIYYK